MKSFWLPAFAAVLTTMVALPVSAQTTSIESLLGEAGDFLEDRCNDVIEDVATQSEREQRLEIQQSIHGGQQEILELDVWSDHRTIPQLVGQDCTVVTNAYSTIITDYFGYLDSIHTSDNELRRELSDDANMRYELETARLLQEQAHELLMLQERQERHDTLLQPFVKLIESMVTPVELSDNWPQGF